jgi:predicted outer membrane repeat protein
MCNFTINNATVSGGAIYAKDSAKLNLTSSILAQNTAVSGAGVLTTANASMHLDRVIFKDNKASKGGGGITIAGNSRVVVMNAVFVNNTNSQGSGGGAIYMYDYGSSNVTHAVFASNQAIENGGGAVALWSNATMVVQDTNFTNNTAGWGGAIMAQENSTLNLLVCRLYNNSATQHGGALEIMGSGSDTAATGEQTFCQRHLLETPIAGFLHQRCRAGVGREWYHN